MDLNPLASKIDEILLQEGASKLWFSTMLQYALVMTVSEKHASFIEIGADVLKMLARNRDVVLNDENAAKALKLMLTIPAHADVLPGLERLKGTGPRLAALTNSSQSGVTSQLAHAGIAQFFEKALSVERIGKYKPH